MLPTVGQGGLVLVIALFHAQAVTGGYRPAAACVRQLQQMIPGMRGERHLILGPGEVGVVGIIGHAPLGRGLPRESQIDTAFVLHASAVAIALGVEGGIAVGVEPLQGDHAQFVGGLPAEAVDRGQMSLLVDGRLTVEGHAETGIAVVEAGVQEVRTLGIVLAIEHSGIGLEPPVKMGVECIEAEVETPLLVAQRATCLDGLQIVFLLHLGLCAVIACREDGRYGGVLVQRGIHLAP